MLFFLFTTSKCNKCCKYCGNVPIEDLMPAMPSVTIPQLKTFLSTSPDDSNTIVFYGGEPLLNIPFLYSVMDNIDARFVLQTNGTLLHKLNNDYLSRISSILVSIDGIPSVVDEWRGRNTYKNVMEQVSNLRNRGFTGDLIARMTISKDADIYRDARHLLSHEVSFDHIHWQLDCQWDAPMDEKRPDFPEFIASYNEGISRLINEWTDRMEQEGVVSGIVPFLGIARTLLFNVDYSNGLQCGVGHHSFTIGTKGNVLGCPVSWEDDWNNLGQIDDLDCSQIKNTLKLDNPCSDCEILNICGGRCLFANKTKWWGDEGFKLVCGSIEHLINEIKRVLPKIQALINSGNVNEDDFRYNAMDNSMEVIP
ncbi:hypothetical protein GEMRC1_011586 [Eukaryota sp. GEM-RC1]